MCPRPRPEPGGGARTGKGYLAARPPQARPRPALAGDSGSRACLCCGAGAWVCPVTAPRGTHPPESSRPGFHSAPSKPVPCARQRPPGVARHPSARAPGVLPSPLPSHGPRGLDASAAAARSNAGAGWTGLQGPVSMGRGGRRGPDSGSASPTGTASAGRLSSGVPACS